MFGTVLAWIDEQYESGALLMACQVLLPIFIIQFILIPAFVEWILPEPRPTINVSHLNQETGERTHLNIPDYNNDHGYRWNTQSLSAVLAEKSRRPDNLPKTLQVEISLHFNQLYLNNFLKKAWLLAHRQMRMLRKFPVWSVDVWDLPVHESEMRRWRLLCETLGSIPTLKEVTLMPLRQYHARAATLAIGSMKRISRLVLSASFGEIRDEKVLDEFARALRGLSTLTWLQYDSRNVSHAILSAVNCIPSLQNLCITNEYDETMTFKSSFLLSQFLRETTLPSITLSGLRFPTQSSCRPFCEGISQTCAKSINVSYAQIAEAEVFARSLAASGAVTRLAVSYWRDPANLHAFLSNLAQALPETKLEALNLQFLCGTRLGEEHTDKEELQSVMESVLPTLVRAAARCLTLLKLQLPFAAYTTELDKALAHLMESSCSRLQTLVLGCPLRQPGDDVPARYPLFFEALKGNVAMQRVDFKYEQPSVQRHAYLDPWCDDFKQQIATVTRLNRAGRKYLKTDKPSKLEGCRVLEKVKDDMDCVFFHLREIPTLVQG